MDLTMRYSRGQTIRWYKLETDSIERYKELEMRNNQ